MRRPPPSQEDQTMLTRQALSRRRFLRTAGASVAITTLSGCSPRTARRLLCSDASFTPAKRMDEPVPRTADAAFQRLLEGNRRHAAGHPLPLHESAYRRLDVAQGQQPFATIFGCVDSRVPPEIVFDAGLGDLFVIRTAGHVLDSAVLGSLEFGVAELEIPLLLVLGHERCGAVTATLDAVEEGTEAEADIAAVVESIRPSVESAIEQPGDPLDTAVRIHVEQTVLTLREQPFFAEALAGGALAIVGAYYDLDTGMVDVIVP